MAVVDAESEDNWLWFLQNLKLVVSNIRRLTFISDRNHGLVVSIPKVFPGWYHGYCLWHLKNNLSVALPGKNPKKPFILKLFSDCAYAATHLEFQKVVADFEHVGGPHAVDFLRSLPLERWANAYFSGRRYGDMCSNISESYNSWILKERNMPIKTMVDKIRSKVMKLMSDRREICKNWKTVLCPKMEKKLREKIDNSRSWKVIKSSEFIFEVQDKTTSTHRVNLQRLCCSCNWWQIEGFPCDHAVLSILADGKSVYEFCDRYLYSDSFRESYSHSIYPIPDLAPVIDIEADDVSVLPPAVKKNPGRPKKKRLESSGAREKKMRRCGNCHCFSNHNKKTCPKVDT